MSLNQAELSMEVIMHEASTASGGNNSSESSAKYNKSVEIPVNVVQNEDGTESGTFTKLSPQQQINLKFEDIKYTASLGFRKGLQTHLD